MSLCNNKLGQQEADVLRMQFLGSNKGVGAHGDDLLPGTSNYFIGHDPSSWRTSIPTYARVRYPEIYNGIDLVYYGNQRQLEFDFIVAPNANPRSIRLQLEGAAHLAENASGALTIATPRGDVLFKKPLIYQLRDDGSRRPITGGFRLMADNIVRVQVGKYDRSRPLVIDPTLAYSTYLGGSTQEYAVGLAVDSAGEAFATGLTWSVDFPLTPGAFESVNQAYIVSGVSTAFISKLNSSGTALLYSTYLGGSAIANTEHGQGDYGHAIAIDTQGNAYVTGWTYSSNFPVTSNAFQITNKAVANSEATGFISKLNSNGTVLIYSTFLGGSTLDEPISIALDSQNNVFTTGFTFSTDYPTTVGALQTTNNSGSRGQWNTFVSKLNSNGSGLVYSTYLGGSGEYGSTVDGNYAGPYVAVDGSDDAFVESFAQSSDFPVTTGAYQTANKAFANGGSNITLSKLNPAGTGLVYSTYIGGSSNPGDFSEGLVLDSSGNVYVTGYTYSHDFPVISGAFQSTNKGAASGNDTGFVAKVNPSGTGLVYSTYLGGSGGDDAYSVALDNSLDLYVAGTSASADFPVTANSYQSTLKASSDAYVVELNPSGSSELYGTYFGGSGNDGVYQVALDPLGNVYLAGYTGSSDFPVTPGAFETTYNSEYNTAFVAEFSAAANSTLTATKTTLTASQDPQPQGQAVTFTAAVEPASGTTVPSGSMVFSVDESPVATVQLDSTGKATYTTSALNVSQHYVFASYSGSNTFAQSAGTLTETITGTTATPVITPAPGTYAVPQIVTITDGTAGATIYYTLDGSTPTTASTIYGVAFSISSTTTVKAMAVASGDTPSAITTATYAISTTSLTLVDPAPYLGSSLLDGLEILSAQAPAVGSTPSGADRLATKGRIVSGVAADGVTEVVVRIPMTTVNSTVTLTVMTDPADNLNADSACTLSALQASTSPPQDGGLEATGQLIPAFGSSITVTSVNTIDGPMAFAVYSAPEDFVRPANTYDAALKNKSVCLVTSDNRSVNIAIYRPPVFLIHGIWSGPDAWNTFMHFSPEYPDLRFDAFPADYSQTAGDSVSTNEPIVLSQLRAWIWSYELTYQIAAVQADVIAHSMGGLITRDMLLDPSFLSSQNRLKGLIHKLITIDTPHGGSQFASRLENAGPQCAIGFGIAKHPVAGGVSDLIPGSALLTSLNSGPPSILAHAIVGQASTTQESSSEALIGSYDLGLIPLACPNLLGGGFEAVFGGSSDLIVSATSQQFGFTTNAVSLSPGTIHAVISGLFEPGPDALDTNLLDGQLVPSAAPINSPKVVDLLNTPITDPSFESIQP
jgi:pimeloyl-ACP methyl ester carboxylesterase